MAKVQICLISFMCGMLLSMTLSLIKIEKEMKEIKDLKLTIDNVESQLKILTPPPEFFMLPEVTRK